MDKQKIVIVGGVAGGASFAARARRLSEDCDIVMFERGAYVSFANCGLPYYVGQVIEKEEDLLVATPALFRDRYDIDVRLRSNVTGIDREKRCVLVEDLKSGRCYQEPYDHLILATGSRPVRPPLEGIDLPGIFQLATIPDSRAIMDWIDSRRVRRAVVVGGGFIGLEMAENLALRGIAVTLVEMLDQVMPPLDAEMAAFAHVHLAEHGVDLRLGTRVGAFASGENRLQVLLAGGDTIATDMVLLAIGVQPQSELAAEAGLSLGHRRGVQVDRTMTTDDPHIRAVGDVVEVQDYLLGRPTLVPLAGPANRQGRIAADHVAGCGTRPFRGVQGTSVCGIMGLTVASTGASEKSLVAAGYTTAQYEKVYLHPDHHAGYYPGAETLTLKLIFTRPEGRILGAQAVGRKGVEKRVDVIAMAIQMQGTVFDLEQAELCYAPPYGSARDPVNLAGMIAGNVLSGIMPVCHWADLPPRNRFLLDVRTREEFAEGHVEEAVNIPVDELRGRWKEIPPGEDIFAYCYVGQRSYTAVRFLLQKGFRVVNVSGGYRMYTAFFPAA